MFFHGGFDPVKPNHPLDSMIAIDLSRQSELNQKVAKFELLEDKKPDRNIQSAQQKFTQEKVARDPRSVTPLRQASKQQAEKGIRIAPVVITAHNNDDHDLGQFCFK